MDDEWGRLRVSVLERYKKELCGGKVKFCDISHPLLTSSHLSREDCYQICILPLSLQMTHCYTLLVRGMQQPRPPDANSPDLWTILLRSLSASHSALTCKLDAHLHKLSKREKPLKVRKEDIGQPQNFQHVKHIGHVGGFRRFFSLRSNHTSSPILLGDSDPDIRAFFTKAGVTQKHLKQPRSRQLILDFLDKNGGREAIKREMKLEQGQNAQNGGNDDKNVDDGADTDQNADNGENDDKNVDDGGKPDQNADTGGNDASNYKISIDGNNTVLKIIVENKNKEIE